jgi:glycosyltransferase involved in cell wall biosynthesis
MDVTSQPKIRVLSFSIVFPNPADPTLGVFVRSRLQHIADSGEAEVIVVAPIPIIDYANYHQRMIHASVPGERTDGPIRVVHPRWLYPPFGTVANCFCLFGAMLAPVRRLRRRFDFDLIDAHFGHPEGLTAALLSRCFGRPFLVTLRGNEAAMNRWNLRRIGMGWALRQAARVITVSPDLAEFAISLGADPVRVKCVPNGIDAGNFHPRDRAECRRKHGIAEGTPVVLSAGYLIERKGHHRAVRALAEVRRRGIPGELLIAGGPGREGEFESKIRAAVAETKLENAVRFLGPVSPAQMAELMCAADVLCLATNREGWPNVVHEAMACGTPVVATAVGGVPQMIPGEKYGYVVPPHDQDALNQALGNALSRTWDRGRIAAYGQERSWDQVAREVLNEMRAVVQPRSMHAHS